MTTRSLLLEISEKEGLYAFGAKSALADPSYTDSMGLNFLKDLHEQADDGVTVTLKTFGKDLLDKIDQHLNPKNKEIIFLKKNKAVTEKITVYGMPSPGSPGDYCLLKAKYKRMDDSWIDHKPDAWRRIQFSYQFSIYMLEQFGELHCEYCGKPDLIVTKWYEKQHKLICTVDHFYPRKDYPHLTEVTSNLFICCAKCNNKKDRKIVNEEQIAYRYDDDIRVNFVFDESLMPKERFQKPE